MKHILVGFILFITSLSVHALSFKVGDIRLEGLQRVSADPVFAALPIRSGETINNQDVRNIIQSMLQTGFFNNVQVARDGNVLILILEERPAIKSIDIDGNKLLKTEQLLEVLNDNGLDEGEILKKPALQGIARSIENQYISQARYDASVNTKIESLANNMVSIQLDIDEGSAASIRQIHILGNDAFADEELKALFEQAESKWYKPFSKKDKYGKDRLTGDIETLESFYLDRGYLDFKVVSSRVSVSPDKESLFITIGINEGNPYKVGELKLEGDPKIDPERVKRLFLLKKGDVYSKASMTRSNEFISTMLGNSGYTNAEVEEVTEKKQDTGIVDITVFVDPGKRNYVRRINFSGNTKTTDEVLRREMRQMEGSSASNSNIERSKVRLDRLGFFKEVNVETVDVPGKTDLVDVNFDVEEQPSGSISASLGYADYSGVNLGFNVSESNWLGSGNNVSIGVNKNKYQDFYNFSYTDPYYTPEGVTRGISLYHRLTNYDEVNFNGSYSTDSTGADVTFGYPISEVSFLRFGAGLRRQSVTTGSFASQQIQFSPFLFDNRSLIYVNQSDIESPVPSLNGVPLEYQLETSAIQPEMLYDGDELGFIDKYGSDFNTATFTASWSRRTLNRGVLATRGNSQVLSAEVTVPGSDLEYYKLTYDAQLFRPINSFLTLRFKTKLGYGNGYGDMTELPFFENYRAGGPGSVRGFEKSTLGPKIDPPISYLLTNNLGWIDLNDNGVKDNGERLLGTGYILCDNPTSPAYAGCTPGKLITRTSGVGNSSRSSFGGNILMEFSSELLLPIPFIEDSRTMQLAAFVDAGNVFSTDCRDGQLNCHTPGLSSLSSSYGLSFKWLSAMGPLTFSLARPIDKNEFDQTKFFDFTFGTGF